MLLHEGDRELGTWKEVHHSGDVFVPFKWETGPSIFDDRVEWTQELVPPQVTGM